MNRLWSRSRIRSRFWTQTLILGLLTGCVACAPSPAPESRGEASADATDDVADAVAETGGEPEDPRRPRHDIVQSMRLDQDTARHPSDGGGKAELRILEPADGVLRAAGRGRFEIVYTAGPQGVAEGGAIYLQASPFWGWSTPQTENPRASGYTTVESDVPGLELEAATVDRQLLAVFLRGGALEAGQSLRLVYGAGPALAVVDRYAERGENLWIAVDGDGDGIRKLIEESPSVDIRPGVAARLVVFGPATARPGEEIALHVSLLDGFGNGPVPVKADFELDGRSVKPTALGAGWTLPWSAGESGTYRPEVTAQAARGRAFRATSSPILVAPSPTRFFWADLQIHSRLSDGTGEPEDLYAYGRDVARLDIMGLTDHDHWGLRFLDQEPDMQRRLASATDAFHEPGVFVTVPGYEWTSWIHGHRHVLVFDDRPLEIFSSIDEAYDHPTKLWQGLEGRLALTVAHHSAGGPIAVDWSIAPPPIFEPVTEVVSVHGSSESADTPLRIGGWVDGNSVRQAALGRGYRLGMIGSTDGHDGHPGLGHLASPSGGLAAIWATELTRDGVYEALRARRTYATSGPRILVQALVAGYRMGSEVPVRDGVVSPRPEDERLPLDLDRWWVRVAGTEILERIDWIDADGVRSFPCEDLDCTVSAGLPRLEAGGFVYLRAVQRDGHFALTSPWFPVE